MDVEDVGTFRYCPACARPIGEAEFLSEDPATKGYDLESVRCSCCERPWIACPCTPASEGSCRAIESHLSSRA